MTSQLPALGLCCLTSNITISYKTITKKRFDNLNLVQKEEALKTIYKANVGMFISAIKYCANNNIPMYRVTSHLFPFYETEVGTTVLDRLGDQLQLIGVTAEKLNIRVVMHPDQWVVLSSDNLETIRRSINELVHHATIFDLIGLSRSHYNLLNIHGGKRGNSKTLVSVINDLPDNVRYRLTLENDERCYSTTDLFKVHELTNVPILFDFHHSLVNNRCCSYDHKTITQEFELSKTTWSNKSWQTTHISNGFTGLLDNKHSDYITRYPECLLTAPWVEVEARMKEQALFQLRDSMESYYAPRI